MADIDWSKGEITNPAASGGAPDWNSGTITAPPKPKGFISDIGTALKTGVQQLPGVVTGLADIPAGLVGMDRPFSKAADRAGKVTGFTPGEWAKEATYSPATQESQANIDVAWKDPNAGAMDVAGAYLTNPRATALNIVQSVPSMAAGGVVGRGLGVISKLSGAARGAIGEGAVMAGQAEQQIDPTVDPQRAAAAALATGVGGAAIGYGAGRLAQRMGVADVDTLMAGRNAADAARPAARPGLFKSIAVDAGQEALLEEAPQSVLETGAQNLAEGNDLGKGMARNVVEGALAGGVMGAGAGAIGHLSPAEKMGIDPNAGPFSKASALAVNSGTVLALPAPTVTVDGKGTAKTADQRNEDRQAGITETGALGEGRNSDPVQEPQPLPEQQPGLPALGYDTSPTGRLIAGEDGLRAETRADAINDGQSRAQQQAAREEERQRRVDLGQSPFTPVTPIEDPAAAPAQAEQPRIGLDTTPTGTLITGADGVARPEVRAEQVSRDQPAETIIPNRVRAGKMARDAGPGNEVVPVTGGFVVRKIEDATPAAAADQATAGVPAVLPTEPAGNGASLAPAGQQQQPDASLTELRRQWPGLDGAPDDQVLASDAWSKAEQRLTARIGTSNQAKMRILAMEDRAIEAFGGPKRVEADRTGYLQALTTSLNSAAAALDPKELTLDDLDYGAHQAATSPTNDLPAPTQPQIEAGNYKKGHIKVHGLDITVENPRGSSRSGTSPDGTAWSHEMSDHYGYLRRTKGADGEQVDVYVGPKPDAGKVFVVDQIDQGTGGFDEHKAMLGYPNQMAAMKAYRSNFDKGWKVGPVKAMSVDEFKGWLKGGDTTAPVTEMQKAIAGDLEKLMQQDLKAELQAKRGGEPAPREARQRQSPLRSFLREAGIDPSLAADVTGERGLRANQRLPGTFRRGGKQLDELVTLARERGFLSDADVASTSDTGGTRKLVDLIQAELRGERQVSVDKAGDTAEARASARAGDDLQRQADAVGFDTTDLSDDQVAGALQRIERRRTEAKTRRDAFDIKREVEMQRAATVADDAFTAEELNSLDADWFRGDNADLAQSMRAMGFTEQEITDAVAQEAEKSTGPESLAGPAARAAEGSPEPGQAAEGEPEGLTAPTRDDVLAQQARKEHAEKEEAKSDAAAEKADKAARGKRDIDSRQAASADNFELGQSAEDGLSGQGSMFSRTDTSPSEEAQITAAIKRQVEAITKAWANKPEVIVIQDLKDPRAPAAIRDLDQAQRSQGASGEPDGFIHAGMVYLVASQMMEPADVQRVLYHEALGHFGLRSVFGDSLDPILKQIATLRRPDVAAKASQYGLDMSIESERLQAAEEVLAEMAQSRPDLGFVRNAVAAMRTWLRENLPGFSGLRMSDAEIVRNYLLPARGFVERGAAAAEKPQPFGTPAFSRTKAESTSAMGTMTPDQERAWARVAGLKEPPTVKQRAQALKSNIGLRLRQGIVDQFAPIKDVSQDAYMQARLSKGSDGTMEAALLYGKPFLKDGVPDVDVKEGGFAKVLAGLKGEHDRFLWWVAAQRAERLKAEGKENLFSTDDITALKSLNAGQMADGGARIPVYAKAMAELNAFNDSVLEVAEKSGLIDAEARDLFKGQPYVPFYRVMEEGPAGMTGPRFSSGLVGQSAYKKLKGGSDKLNGDLLENMLLNWSHLYAAAARNRAAVATMDSAEKMAVAYKVPDGTKGSIKVMRDGAAEHWAVEDPYLMEAISALHYVPSPLIKPLAALKQVLTWGVTINPTFKIRNLIRDSLSAVAQADLSYNPLENVAKGWKATAKDSQSYASMLAGGGVIKFGSGESSERVRNDIKKLGGELVDEKGWKKLTGAMGSLWDAYNEFGDRTENVNRAALYERLIAKGHSPIEANFMARDLMDFSMSGRWDAVRFLTQTVPFMNARLQGLYKLGRAAAEDPRRFGAMAAAVSLASLGLMAAYGDDDDWKKREDFDRDSYWWFKIGDTAYRIPKPFELGSIGTIAERTAELMLSDEMTGKRFGERLSAMVFQTFAMDPVPQAFKPLLDVYSNKDSFTKRAIEGQGDEKLRPQDRIGERTSEVARLVGSWGLPEPLTLLKGEYKELSPKQVDFLLRGYFSWAGSTVAGVTDLAARPFLDRGEKPAMRLKDTFVAGSFIESLPTGSSRYVTQLYDQARDVEQAWASYQDALKRGDTEKAQEIKAEDGAKFATRLQVERAKRQLSEVNKQARQVESNRMMSADAKRDRLTALELQRDAIARRVPAS